MLVTAALLALAAELLSGGYTAAASARPVEGVGDVAEFLREAGQLPQVSRPEVTLRVDPFGGSPADPRPNSVASRGNTSTVSSGATRHLTAILVANNRPVAVIDNDVVGVGDTLRGGARISRIQSDRVFLIEKDGKWRTLTLAQGRP